MHIARVFPSRTSHTPVDVDAYYDAPDMLTPKYDEVHISTVFTWDIPRAKDLARSWEGYGLVKIGGPALGDPGSDFVRGMYLREGITITSRGCPNKCGFCFVPKREGALRELPIVPGSRVADNNLLACSGDHIDRVFNMLKAQRAVIFSGGFEAGRIDDTVCRRLSEISLKEVWIACDSRGALNAAVSAIRKMKAHSIPAYKIRCYVLVGKDIDEERDRLMQLLSEGCYPFAQIFRSETAKEYSREFKDFARQWSRPAIYKSFLTNKGVKP